MICRTISAKAATCCPYATIFHQYCYTVVGSRYLHFRQSRKLACDRTPNLGSKDSFSVCEEKYSRLTANNNHLSRGKTHAISQCPCEGHVTDPLNSLRPFSSVDINNVGQLCSFVITILIIGSASDGENFANIKHDRIAVHSVVVVATEKRVGYFSFASNIDPVHSLRRSGMKYFTVGSSEEPHVVVRPKDTTTVVC
jgi:hypothetical protein